MAGGVPYQHIVFPLEICNLFVKQAVVCGQPRKENQGGRFRALRPADPVMDLPAGRRIDFFLHGRHPP